MDYHQFSSAKVVMLHTAFMQCIDGRTYTERTLKSSDLSAGMIKIYHYIEIKRTQHGDTSLLMEDQGYVLDVSI